MDRETRVALLRVRFRANGGVPFVATGISRPKPGPAKRGRVYMPWPDIIVDHKRTPEWMMVTAHKPMPAIRPIRKTEAQTALTRMSRKLCLKLPKVQP